VAGVVFLGLKMADNFHRRSSGTGTRARGRRFPDGSEREMEVRDWKRVDFPDWFRPVIPMNNDMTPGVSPGGPAILRRFSPGVIQVITKLPARR